MIKSIIPYEAKLALIMKKFMTYMSTLIVTFLAPIKGALILIIFLVVADTITGVMKAGKNSVSDIKSKKAFRLVPKLIFYFIIVILAHSVSLAIDAQIPWVKLSLVGISWIELKSIDENFKELFGFSFFDKCLEAGKKIKELKRP